MARPMPRELPVTSAVCPSSRRMACHYMCRLFAGWNRQRDREQGASAGAGGSFYIARVLGQNRFTNAQAEACSAPRPRSRIGGVEDVGEELRRHGGAAIVERWGERGVGVQ